MNARTHCDDGLEWLREIRRKIAQDCDHDPHKLGDLYRRIYAEEMERRNARAVALREEHKP